MNDNPYYVADFPLLINEWDYSKNVGLNPQQISYGSDRYVYWKCSVCGNGWKARVKTRNKGEGCGCPKCAINKRMGKKYKQKLSKDYNLAVKAPHLLVEWNKDKNMDISPYKLTPYSAKLVWWTCKECGNDWKTVVARRYLGSGCPYCARHNVIRGVNDLATIFPELLDEWDYETNKDVIPHNILPYSSKRVYWKCKKCGGKWDAIIRSRSKGAGCPYCSGRRVLTGYNDLATVNPKLAEEWNYDLNGDLKPQDVFPRSKANVWWKCKKCNYEWKATIGKRDDGIGKCRFCKNK